MLESSNEDVDRPDARKRAASPDRGALLEALLWVPDLLVYAIWSVVRLVAWIVLVVVSAVS